MSDRTITMELIGRDKSLSSSLDKAGKSATKNGGIFGKVGKGIGTAMKAGTLAAGGDIVALGAFLVQGVKDAASYQQVVNQTAQVIKSTGNAAHISVAGVKNLASSLETMSGVDEELIIHSQNVLATFTNIKNVGKNRIFDEATKSTLDLSVAMHGDLQGASVLVGKALNDPIKGLSALGRVGVQFTDQQKKVIASMVKTGDTAGAQKVILGELNKEYGGNAKAAGQGFAGEMLRVKDSLGDAGRAIGQVLLPAVTSLAKWFNEKFPPAAAKAQAIATEFFSTLKTGMTQQDTATGIETAALRIRDAFNTAKTTVGNFITLLKDPTFQKVAEFVLVFVGTIKTVIVVTNAWKAAQVALDVALNANPISLVVIAIGLLVAGIVLAYTHSEKFRIIFNTVFKAASNIILNFVSDTLGAFAKIFAVMGKLPGPMGAPFRAAATAAKFAKAQVDNLRTAINKLPTKKTTNIGIVTTYSSIYKTGSGPGTYGNGLGVLKKKAAGGPVNRDEPYLVGENGPEVLMPGDHPTGTIIPNKAGGRTWAGGGDTYITLNVSGVGDQHLADAVITALRKVPAGSAKIPRRLVSS